MAQAYILLYQHRAALGEPALDAYERASVADALGCFQDTCSDLPG